MLQELQRMFPNGRWRLYSLNAVTGSVQGRDLRISRIDDTYKAEQLQTQRCALAATPTKAILALIKQAQKEERKEEALLVAEATCTIVSLPCTPKISKS